MRMSFTFVGYTKWNIAWQSWGQGVRGGFKWINKRDNSLQEPCPDGEVAELNSHPIVHWMHLAGEVIRLDWAVMDAPSTIYSTCASVSRALRTLVLFVTIYRNVGHYFGYDDDKRPPRIKRWDARVVQNQSRIHPNTQQNNPRRELLNYFITKTSLSNSVIQLVKETHLRKCRPWRWARGAYRKGP